MASEVTTRQHVHSFSWNHHRQTFFNTIFNLKREEAFCDVTLACDGVLFPVHRLVLAMCSDFFNEILTKVPNQQSMLVLVPTVSAEDLESLLTYIYQGEIQISQANLPSIMKAAQTLKIKGLCHANIDGIPWQQYTRCQGQETSNMESGEGESCDSAFFVSPDSPLPNNATQLPPNFPQVEVILNTSEATRGAIFEETIEVDEEEIKPEIGNVWTKVIGEDEDEEEEEEEQEEQEELDPLSVPSVPPPPLSYSPNSSDFTSFESGTSQPLEFVFSDSSYQDHGIILSTGATTASTSASASGARYTSEQRLQIVKNYYNFGPVRTARLMSQVLGRKINESSVRSIVRTWIRNQKAAHKLKQNT